MVVVKKLTNSQKIRTGFGCKTLNVLTAKYYSMGNI